MNTYVYEWASDENMNKMYSHNAQIYLNIPNETLSRHDIEELAVERLNLLKLIGNSKKRGYKTYSNEWIDDVMVNLSKTYKNTFYKLCIQSTDLSNTPKSVLDIRKMDYISHHILRMGFSTLNELQHWFIEREIEWLYLRYHVQNIESKQSFLFLNNINYTRINDKEKEKILENLCEGQHKEMCYYKVDFKDAIDLIKDRSVFLKGGCAYVPFQDIIFCVMTRYKSYLQKVLLHTSRNLCLLDTDYSDLVKLIKYIINQEYNTANYNVSNTSTNVSDDNSNRQITISELKKFSRDSFPLCMKSLYDQLKEDHHLKYGSRIQLGNFLKATGLSLDDSLKFWSNEFTYKMTQTRFDANYAYYIRHMYGTVGCMKEYLHDSCVDVIKHNIGTGETHGCPFKTWDTLSLTEKFKKLKFSQSVIDEIISDILNKHYQQACCKYFKAIHNVSHDMTIDSPLQYFDQSKVVLRERKKPYETVRDDSEDEADET